MGIQLFDSVFFNRKENKKDKGKKGKTRKTKGIKRKNVYSSR